jgi:retron-type reverse transcriptase
VGLHAICNRLWRFPLCAQHVRSLGVMEDGLVRPVDEGTPQGGPLSPLLSNLVLNDLDKELERRGHRFCRYADDCAPRRREEEVTM